VTGVTVSAGRGWPTHFPALLGPLLAAFGVTAWRDGLLRRMVRVRVALRWWLLAVSPLLLLLLVLAVDAALAVSPPAYGRFAVFSGLPSHWGPLAVAAVLLLVDGFGEETGWRGFALPSLQKRHSRSSRP
jgi:membrane protease YdiL (CAAX protease family)